MRILVAGSVATDELMIFPGKFSEHILPEQLGRISLSFLIEELSMRKGGTGANITFGLGSLGVPAALVASVGKDFDTSGYRAWLDERGVDTSLVAVSASKHTARFVCTTDEDMCQIASFYSGAMQEARDIDLTQALGSADLLVVSPDDEEAMVRHTARARAAGVPFLADTSFQLVHMQGQDRVRSVVDGAAYLVLNDYEKTLLEQKSGWSSDEVLEHVGVQITTLGAKGVIAERAGEPAIQVAAVPERAKVDPTGAGDALRAGFLAALSWGVDLERCLQVGAMLGTLAIETVGTQEYDVAGLANRFADAYGEDAADEIRSFLPPQAV